MMISLSRDTGHCRESFVSIYISQLLRSDNKTCQDINQEYCLYIMQRYMIYLYLCYYLYFVLFIDISFISRRIYIQCITTG